MENYRQITPRAHHRNLFTERDHIEILACPPRPRRLNACEKPIDQNKFVPGKASKRRREEIALWLFIIAVIIISFLAGHLFWVKLSLHQPS